MAWQREGPRRDQGSILPLVLVLMVIAGLIVVPLLGYTVAVFRSNRVVSDRTAAVEAAKGGVRMAVGDPGDVFRTCGGGGGDLTPVDPQINGIAVTVSCSLIQEIGPNEALQFEVPIGAVAMQLGAGVPPEFSGSRAQSPAVPPYPIAPATPNWWLGLESATAANNKIWMPILPRLPSVTRPQSGDPTVFDMPTGFDCKVYFPGRYSTPLSVTGNVYFTSGVYYFEQPVTVSGNANVVVGFGLEELPNPDCSDDIQVAANVLAPPDTFDISGGGATWVFGRDGRLIVDDSTTTTSLRLVFNQRYDEAARGGRISIMTANGDNVLVGDHVVTNVNHVPRSLLPDGITKVPNTGTEYVPSSPTYTDKARLPATPTGFVPSPLQYTDGTGPHGAILLTWNEVTGQAAGGAFIDGYNITLNGAPTGPTVCQPADLVVSVLPGGNTVSCLIKNLVLGTNYNVGVAARNAAGASATPAAGSARPRTTNPISPVISAPVAPTNVAAVGSNVDNVAQISWNASANGGSPVTRYDATAHRIYLQPPTNVVPVANNMNLVTTRSRTIVTGVPAFDPNGDALSLTVDTAVFGAVGTVTVAGRNLTITTAAAASNGTYSIPYTVTDPSGLAASGAISVQIVNTPGNTAPIARSIALAAHVGVPIVSRVPVFDPNGHTMTLALGTATPPLDPLKWTVTPVLPVGPGGPEVTITSTAPDGTYTIPYTVTDSTTATSLSNSIVVTIVGDQVVGTCQVSSTPGAALGNACEIGLPDLVPGTPTSGNVGYRFDVTATNAIGTSAPGSNPAPFPLAFNGGGVALPPPAVRTFEPWKPVPIIDIKTTNTRVDVQVAIAGYVAVPMGRIAILNPDKDAIKINGGVVAGTFNVLDDRAVPPLLMGSLPIGFKNDIVLQRKVKIVATARNIRAIAIVQVNEDGAKIRINSWVIQ